ncbi:phosphate transport system permease protein [Nakamurella panacisegetis]|uniref:Phosphate transport system permease protein PstA n=1 Tax=Nakamurella panacisegetis TaxID=1090615 RepID=A0A1H0JLZ2_9ACTN|nr:phosphate ABC transporter permease PstA [Nakamurella panacisegetis]SDO44513.1 phosphate transport system permease protein [Nakamurella panacisegetis]
MTTIARPTARPTPSALVGARLPKSAPYLSGAAGVLLALALKATLGWTGWLTAFFSAALLFVLLLTGWSFAVEGKRRAKDRFASTLIYSSFVAAVVPLVLILSYIVYKGLPAFNLNFFTHSMNGITADEPGGGVYAALIGTLEQVGLAAVVSLPIGLFTAIYLVEYGRGVFARLVTFFVDVMTGVPSIVAGLFVYTFLLLGTDHRPFGAAGSIALAILMLPVVVRSSEEMLKLVPRELREASFALGVTRWRTIVKIVVPTALSGLITSALLAIARVAGETAPLILLVGYADRINGSPFSADQAALPMMVWDQLGKRTGAGGAYGDSRAWGAALVLVLLVLILNLAARLLARLAKPKSR